MREFWRSTSLGLPVLITNTHAVGACHQGVIEWAARNKPDIARQWLLPVIAETWDGYPTTSTART